MTAAVIVLAVTLAGFAGLLTAAGISWKSASKAELSWRLKLGRERLDHGTTKKTLGEVTTELQRLTESTDGELASLRERLAGARKAGRRAAALADKFPALGDLGPIRDELAASVSALLSATENGDGDDHEAGVPEGEA